jgi:hypothetical protein
MGVILLVMIVVIYIFRIVVVVLLWPHLRLIHYKINLNNCFFTYPSV